MASSSDIELEDDPRPSRAERAAGLPAALFGAFMFSGFLSMRAGMHRRPPKDLPARVFCELLADTFAVVGAVTFLVGVCYCLGLRLSILDRMLAVFLQKLHFALAALVVGSLLVFACYWFWPNLAR